MFLEPEACLIQVELCLMMSDGHFNQPPRGHVLPAHETWVKTGGLVALLPGQAIEIPTQEKASTSQNACPILSCAVICNFDRCSKFMLFTFGVDVFPPACL